MNRKFLILMVLLCLLVGGVSADNYMKFHPDSTGTSDACLRYQSTGDSYATNHNGAVATDIFNTTTTGSVVTRRFTSNTTFYYIGFCAYSFNTSALAGKTITGANFTLSGSAKDNGAGDANYTITGFFPTDPHVLQKSDFNKRIGTAEYTNTRISYTDLSTTGNNTWIGNTAMIGNISTTGYTNISVRDGWDVLNAFDGGGTVNYASSLFTSRTSKDGGYLPTLNVSYSSPPPVASFTANKYTCDASDGFPCIVVFTDTSTNSPTSWGWNLTNITPGNNTRFEVSTLQNPSVSLGVGNWKVDLTAANAAGSNVSSQITFVNVTTVIPVVHPITFNVRQSPGYLNRTIAPWSTAEVSIISNANTALTNDYYAATTFFATDTTAGGSRGVASMATAYQITGDTKYVNKTVQALLNYDRIAAIKRSQDSGITLGYQTESPHYYMAEYAYAYDQIAQTLGVNSTLDAANNTAIRNGLANATDQWYYGLVVDDPSYAPKADGGLGSYISAAIVGEVLGDYRNNTMNTSVSDWKELGGDALFTYDKTRSFSNVGVIYTSFNKTTGRSIENPYRYYTENYWWRWAHISSNIYGNIFERYPAFKPMALEQTWSSMPNHYSGDNTEDGQSIWTAQEAVLSLLDPTNRSYSRWQLFNAKSVNANSITAAPTAGGVLPLAGYISTQASTQVYSPLDFYLEFGNYSSESISQPSQLNQFLGFYTTIRGDWTDRSDWMSFVIWDMPPTMGQRESREGDQLSYEYYSKGNLLLADGGEIKHLTGLTPYGSPSILHNAFLVGNGTINFSRIGTPNTSYYGIYKSVFGGDVTPAYRTINPIDTASMTYIDGGVTMTTASSDAMSFQKTLTTPISFNRALMYPKDYMIVIDRASSTRGDPYDYITNHHLSSLTISPTTSVASSGWGNVTGDLRIGSTPINWKSATLGVEYNPSISTNSIFWDTTNPYGDLVNLTIYTSPERNATYQKYVTRAAGYDTANEVTSPNVYFGKSGSSSLYSVTALLSKYANETSRTPSELTVTGTGSAINVTSADGTKRDTMYTGTGVSTFNGFETDADTLFVRGSGNCTTDYTMVNGTYLKYGTYNMYLSDVRMSYVSYNRAGTVRTVNTSSVGAATQKFYGVMSSPTYVTVDGVGIGIVYDAAGDVVTVATNAGDHNIVFDGDAAANCVVPMQITNLTGVQSSCNSINWSWIDPVDPNYAAIDAYNNNTFYATYLNGTGFVNWTGLPEMLPITFSALARDGSGVPVYNTTWENATVISGACGVAPNASFTYVPHLGTDSIDVQFTDTSVNVPTGWGWFFQNVTGNNTIVQFSTLQNPLHTFEIGNYSIHLNATNMYGSNVTPDINWVNVSPHQTFPPVSAFTSNVTTICPGDYVQFTDMSVNATTWFWLFGSGGVDSHLQNPITNTFDTDGLWDVRLRATNDDGTDWENKTGYITVRNCTKPMGIASCFASFVAINGTYTAEEYNWDFGDGFTGSGISVNHTFQWGRGYTITLSTINESVMTNVTSYYGGCEKQSTAQSSNVGTPLNPMVALAAIVVIAMIVAKRKRGLK